MSLISVIIPTHNRRELLLRAIDSVLAQTHEELEVIVVDDASTDGTQSAVLELHEERVQYVRLNEQRGACVARNRGIDMARGEYIAFQDSDDVFHEDKLEMQLAYLTDPWQPAVLRLVKETCRVGELTATPVGVCGEAAADPLLACVLTGLGVTSLSAASTAVAGVGAQLATVDLATCREVAAAVLDTSGADTARELAREMLLG